MSPKAKKDLAREHLETARDDLSGGREKDAINALFYAAEAAVVALADAHGIDTERRHHLKADAASELYGRGVLKRDFGPLLRQLNQARKDIWYEGDEPELDQSLDEIVAGLETLGGRSGGTGMNPTRLPQQSTAVLDTAWATDRAWSAKLARDRKSVARYLSPERREITETLLQRTVQSGAEAFALTGSTARKQPH